MFPNVIAGLLRAVLSGARFPYPGNRNSLGTPITRLQAAQQFVDEATSLTHLLSLHAGVTETQSDEERTILKDVSFGSGVCDELYHRYNYKWKQPHPFPRKVNVDHCDVASKIKQRWYIFSLSFRRQRTPRSTLTVKGEGSL